MPLATPTYTQWRSQKFIFEGAIYKILCVYEI